MLPERTGSSTSADDSIVEVSLHFKARSAARWVGLFYGPNF